MKNHNLTVYNNKYTLDCEYVGLNAFFERQHNKVQNLRTIFHIGTQIFNL